MQRDGERMRTIGELAQQSGISVRALHHYDDIGLLRPQTRTPGGYRLYSRSDLDRLHLVISLRDLGMPLKAVRQALNGGPPELAEAIQGQLPKVEHRLLSEQLRREQLLHLLISLEDSTESAMELLGVEDTVSPAPQREALSLVGKTLPIGAVYSLTGPGRVYGIPSRNGVLLAEDHINRAGGVNGALVSVLIEDDASDKISAARKVLSLIQDRRVVGLLGPGISHLAVDAHAVANTLRTPMIASSNPGSHVVGPGCPYPCEFIFRTSMGENAILRAGMGALVEHWQPQSGVLMCTSDDKCSADGGGFIGGNLGALGIQLVDSIELSKSSEDVSAAVSRALRHSPDVLFIASLGDMPARLMRCARELGFKGRFFGGSCFNPAAVSKLAGAAGRGAISVNTWHVDNGVDGNAEFVRSYQARFRCNPDQLATQAYVGMLMIADAARRARLTLAGVDNDRLRLQRALLTTSIETPMGRVRFNPEHDIELDTYLVAMNGRSGHDLVGGAMTT